MVVMEVQEEVVQEEVVQEEVVLKQGGALERVGEVSSVRDRRMAR